MIKSTLNNRGDMITELWVSIPNLSKYKTNKVPLKIGDETFGEVLRIIKEGPNNQFAVEALVFKDKKDAFISKIAPMA